MKSISYTIHDLHSIIDFIKESIIGGNEDMFIDTTYHSEERFNRQYHKKVTEEDLRKALLKLYNRLYTLYKNGDIQNNSIVIIVNKNYKPNFNIVCKFTINRKIKLKIITEIFKDNFKPKNNSDYILETY